MIKYLFVLLILCKTVYIVDEHTGIVTKKEHVESVIDTTDMVSTPGDTMQDILDEEE